MGLSRRNHPSFYALTCVHHKVRCENSAPDVGYGRLRKVVRAEIDLTPRYAAVKMKAMKTKEKHHFSPEIMAELAEVLRDPYAPPDPPAMAKACKQIDRTREETRKSSGELDVAVDLIRDARR